MLAKHDEAGIARLRAEYLGYYSAATIDYYAALTNQWRSDTNRRRSCCCTTTS